MGTGEQGRWVGRWLTVLAMMVLLGWAEPGAAADAPAQAGHGTTNGEAHTASADSHAASNAHDAADAHGAADGHGDAHGHGGEHSGGLPQLNPETFPTQLLWLGITFATLYFLVAHVALPKVVETVEVRESRIAHDIDRADELKIEAETLGNQTEAVLSGARSKAQASITHALEEVEKQRRLRLEQLEVELASRLETSETRIQIAKEKALAEVQIGAASLVQDLNKRLVGANIPVAAARRAVASVGRESG